MNKLLIQELRLLLAQKAQDLSEKMPDDSEYKVLGQAFDYWGHAHFEKLAELSRLSPSFVKRLFEYSSNKLPNSVSPKMLEKISLFLGFSQASDLEQVLLRRIAQSSAKSSVLSKVRLGQGLQDLEKLIEQVKKDFDDL